jgi:hypothetical protein
MSTDDEDPILEAQIEAEIARALGPGAGALPPEVLDELRGLLRIGLRHHAGAREVLDQLRPAPSVEKSDKIATAAFKNRKKVGNGGAR